MTNLRLSIATTDYDHFRDFRAGAVRAQGIDPIWLTLGHHEIFARFTAGREWDVSELSFAKFAAQVTRDEPDIVGLPVVCSRLFRFASFYVNSKSGIRSVEDLAGRKVGSPELGAHSCRLHAGVDAQRCRRQTAGRPLVPGRSQRGGSGREGRAESARRGAADPGGGQVAVADARVRGDRLCDHRPAPGLFPSRGTRTSCDCSPTTCKREEEYFQDTGVWPIMHIIAMQRHLLDENPWIARNLYTPSTNPSAAASSACSTPPSRATRSRGCPPTHVACATSSVATHSRSASKRTARRYEQLLLYTWQQGIAHSHAQPEDIFPAGIMTKVVV